EGGTNVVMSSIMVNDNVIDLLATPGARPGDPVMFVSSPQTSYVTFNAHLTTGPADSMPTVELLDPLTNPNGTVAITVTGSLPAGSHPLTAAFAIPSPTNFAQTVLIEALTGAGISVKAPKNSAAPDFSSYSHFYTPENQLAEHMSLPLSEEVKVTLKVSQNLHAGMGPYLLGTLLAKSAKDPLQAGFNTERAFFQEAQLDISGVSQGDGAGGDWADLFSPDFMCQYLTYW